MSVKGKDIKQLKINGNEIEIKPFTSVLSNINKGGKMNKAEAEVMKVINLRGGIAEFKEDKILLIVCPKCKKENLEISQHIGCNFCGFSQFNKEHIQKLIATVPEIDKEFQPTINDNVDALALKLIKIHDEIEKIEVKLKAKKEEYKNIRENELVELLENEGFAVGSKITFKNGRQIILKEFFTAKLPTESSINKAKDPIKKEELRNKRTAGLKWLEDNDLDGIIKNEIIAKLDKGENEKVKVIMKYLMEQNVTCMNEESVNAATLKATLKEQMKEGRQIPDDTFSVFTGTIVDVK